MTAEELEFAKQAIIRGFPRGFETTGQIGGRLEQVVTYGLPDDYFNHYIERVQAVTLEDINRVARQHLHPSRMAVVVVGDRKVIEQSSALARRAGRHRHLPRHRRAPRHFGRRQRRHEVRRKEG